MKKNIEKLAQKLQISSDPNRLKILCLLFGGQKACVSDLAEKLGLSVAVVSYHLQALSKEKLVKPIRDGKMVCYNIEESDFMADLKSLICKYR